MYGRRVEMHNIVHLRTSKTAMQIVHRHNHKTISYLALSGWWWIGYIEQKQRIVPSVVST